MTSTPGGTATGTTSRAGYLLLGALAGLTWAAGFRGWMAQLAWGEGESSYTWMTVVLILMPGVAIGLLLGFAAHARSRGVRPSRWLIFAPALFASALLDPEIFRALIRNGQGGGALMVVITALAVGFVLSRRRWTIARVLVAPVAVAGLLMLTGMGGIAGPIDTARGAWVCLYGLVFMVLLCLASVLPYPPVRPSRGARSWVALGGLVGLAWACALRGFMAEVAGAESGVHWVDTWVFILLPGLLVGCLLGWAEWLRRTGRPMRLLAFSPFLFAAILVRGLVEDPAGMFDDGIGAGTIAIPVLCLVGAHAMSGRGSPWTRVAAGVVGVATLAAWPITATAVAGHGFSVSTPHGLWGVVLYDGLLVVLALAASVPLRAPSPSASPPVDAQATPVRETPERPVRPTSLLAGQRRDRPYVARLPGER